jgi:hypothetical protein
MTSGLCYKTATCADACCAGVLRRLPQSPIYPSLDFVRPFGPVYNNGNKPTDNQNRDDLLPKLSVIAPIVPQNPTGPSITSPRLSEGISEWFNRCSVHSLNDARKRTPFLIRRGDLVPYLIPDSGEPIYRCVNVASQS